MKAILVISISLLSVFASAQTCERELARYSSSTGTLATINSSITVGDTTFYLSIYAKDPSYSAFTVHSDGIVADQDVAEFLEIFEAAIAIRGSKKGAEWEFPSFTMSRSGESIVINNDRGLSGVISLKAAREVAQFIRENRMYFNI